MCRGPWAVGREPWAVGRGSWAVSRGPCTVAVGQRSDEMSIKLCVVATFYASDVRATWVPSGEAKPEHCKTYMFCSTLGGDGVGQAERLEREMCKTYYVLLHFMRATRVRTGCQPVGGYLAF